VATVTQRTREIGIRRCVGATRMDITKQFLLEALVITLLELEQRSVKEVAQLTGWTVPVVKIRAFRARAAMRRQLARVAKEKYL